MPPSTRDGDDAPRRYEDSRAQKQVQRDALARRRRVLAIVAGVLAALLVVLGAVAAVRGGRDGAVQAAAADPTPTDPAATDPAPTDTGTAPDPALAEGRTWAAAVTTSAGAVGLELDGVKAPAAVASFVTLAQKGFFNGTPCHRLVTEGIYVLQCGDPTGTGTGGPGYSYGPVENAPEGDLYPAGTLAMARRGGDGASMGSQFFVVYRDSIIPSDAAGGYTVFGRVTSGLDVVEAVAASGSDEGNGPGDGQPITPVTLETVSVQ